MIGDCRKMHNEELRYPYSSPNVIEMCKSRRMKWAGHVAHIEEGIGAHRILVGNTEGKRRLDDLGVGGRIILKCILNWMEMTWAGLIWLRIGTSDGLS
jgi:hypothetical protein